MITRERVGCLFMIKSTRSEAPFFFLLSYFPFPVKPQSLRVLARQDMFCLWPVSHVPPEVLFLGRTIASPSNFSSMSFFFPSFLMRRLSDSGVGFFHGVFLLTTLCLVFFPFASCVEAFFFLLRFHCSGSLGRFPVELFSRRNLFSEHDFFLFLFLSFSPVWVFFCLF